MSAAAVASPAFPAVGGNAELGGANYHANAEGTNHTVAMDSKGDFVVVVSKTTTASYQGTSGSYGYQKYDPGVYAVRYNSSGQLIGNVIIVANDVGSDKKGIDVNPAVAMDPSGAFVVTWNSYDQGILSVQAERFNASGVLQGTEMTVAKGASGILPVSPSVAMDTAGDFAVTWQTYSSNTGSSNIYAQRYSSQGVAQGSIIKVNADNLSDSAPIIAMDSAGDFVVTWAAYSYDAKSHFAISSVEAQRYTKAGSRSGNEITVGAGSSTTGYSNPSVAMDSFGDFVVTLNSNNSSNSTSMVLAQKYTASGLRTSSPIVVANQSTNGAVAMDAGGDFVATWSHYSSVSAQEYTFAGTKLGSRLSVSNDSTAFNDSPSVAIDAQGDFVVTYESTKAGGINSYSYSVDAAPYKRQ